MYKDLCEYCRKEFVPDSYGCCSHCNAPHKRKVIYGYYYGEPVFDYKQHIELSRLSTYWSNSCITTS